MPTAEQMTQAMEMLHAQQQSMLQQMQQQQQIVAAGRNPAFPSGDIRHYVTPVKQEAVEQIEQAVSSAGTSMENLSVEQLRNLLIKREQDQKLEQDRLKSEEARVKMEQDRVKLERVKQEQRDAAAARPVFTAPNMSSASASLPDQSALIQSLLEEIGRLKSLVPDKKLHGAGALFPAEMDKDGYRYYLVPDALLSTGTACICSGEASLKGILKKGISEDNTTIQRFADLEEAVLTLYTLYPKRYICPIRR